MKAQAEGGSGGAFAALVNREKNAGPARKWVSDRLGAGVKIGDDPRVVTKEGKGWGAVILEGVFRDTSKSSREAKEDNNDYDAADFLLQVSDSAGATRRYSSHEPAAHKHVLSSHRAQLPPLYWE